MNKGSLRSLEFDRIVEAVQSFALTPLGASRLADLLPLTETRSVQAALRTTGECVRYLDANPPLPLEAPSDLDRILLSLAVEGQPLEGKQLRGLTDFLSSIEAVSRAVAQASNGPFPSLWAILEGCSSFAPEVSEIRSKLDETNAVADGASTELRVIRERLRKQRSRLRGALDSYLRGKDTANYLQERVITERGGRFVLVVKTEHRAAIPGIVHESSGSGASLFLEPLSTVEINNDIVALENDETAEVRRILLTLANLLRSRALDLRHTLTAATEIDVIQARAEFSRLINGVEPELVSDTCVSMLQARHPLLIRAVRQRLGAENPAVGDSEPVPVDLHLTPPISVLVITGPNTGGKTVALKTAGLLTLMAQAGLFIPAGPGSYFSVFRTVFVDIGDEQSIVASLSTFSGHMSNIVSMDQQLALPTLLLLDEVGAGTEPVEGGALGAAIIDYFRERGALVMATTHDDTLKSYAATTPHVTCAAFGFNPDTFEPNYRLTYGSPGRSLALEIAARLGVAPSVIKTARSRQSTRETQLADHLVKIEDEMRALEVERKDLEAERAQIIVERAQLDAALKIFDERKDTIRKQFSTTLNDERRAARNEINTIIDKLRKRASALEKSATARAAAGRTPLTTGETGGLRAVAQAALDEVVDHSQALCDQDSTSTKQNELGTNTAMDDVQPTTGSQVIVRSLGLEGKVLSVHDGQAEVEVRGKRLHVYFNELQPIGGNPATVTSSGAVTTTVAHTDEPLGDLNVIGCNVDDALSRTEKYLDLALVREERTFRVIHGHGKGNLRRAIANLLEAHPQVRRFASAESEQGGHGVTVIELKD